MEGNFALRFLSWDKFTFFSQKKILKILAKVHTL